MNAWIAKLNHFLIILMVLLALANCSVIEKPFKSKDNIAEYAELLFKRQNFLTQQVMMYFDEDTNILEAEAQMHDACYLLVEYANRELEEKKMSIFFRRRVKKSFEHCEDSVKNLELILN